MPLRTCDAFVLILLKRSGCFDCFDGWGGRRNYKPVWEKKGKMHGPGVGKRDRDGKGIYSGGQGIRGEVRAL